MLFAMRNLLHVRKNGFTLLELLTMFCIMCALVSIALPSFLEQRDKANISAANTQVKLLMTACQLEYLKSNPNYTTIDANLQAAQPLGKITWTPTVTAAACSAVTTGAPTTQGSWSLNTTTDEVTIIEAE